MTDLRVPFDEVRRFSKSWMEAAGVPGLAVAVTSPERTLESFTFGVADVGSGDPVTADTLFEIGSLGKPFTSIALLQLRDEGTLDLHRPVSDYLPWFRARSAHAPITVHHLMNHTSGLIRGTEMASHGLYDVWALRDIEVGSPPGEYFCYSSLGYKILGFLLEALTGQSYGKAIETRVLGPLGMTHSHAVTTIQTRAGSATGYCGFYDDRPEHRSHPVAPAPWQEFGTGDGCQASTANDMARYLRMLLNRGRAVSSRVLSEESFDLMIRNGIWTGGDFYGYGLATYTEGERVYIGHGGGNAGFRSAMVIDMEAGLGVVFLLNRMGETDPVVAAAQHALTVLRCAKRGEPVPADPPALHSEPLPEASAYAGTYQSDRESLELTAKDGKLILSSSPGTPVLERRGPDRFFVPHPDYALFLLEFVRRNDMVEEAFHGSKGYIRKGRPRPRPPAHPPSWGSFVGHYRTRNPELSNFRVVLRKGALVLIIPWGDSFPLHPVGEDTFRVGDDAPGPERVRFSAVVQGQALRADYSGCPYFRTFTP